MSGRITGEALEGRDVRVLLDPEVVAKVTHVIGLLPGAAPRLAADTCEPDRRAGEHPARTRSWPSPGPEDVEDLVPVAAYPGGDLTADAPPRAGDHEPHALTVVTQGQSR